MATQTQPIEAAQQVLKVKSGIGQSLLAVAYLRMEFEGLLPMMFWQKTPTLKEFLDMAEQPDVCVVGCFVETGPTLELAGLGWLHNVKTRNGRSYADVGEVFWRSTQAAGLSGKFGRLLVDFAFEACGMRSIFGVTPEKNVAAVRFMRHMGFKDFGPIPRLCYWNGEECGGYISTMTDEMWAAQKQEVS